MIRHVLLVGGLLLALSMQSILAQERPAEDYFHAAAQQYIGEEVQQAIQTAQAGLQAHPGDAKLQALLEKLQQKRERQTGSGNESGQQQQQDNASESNAASGQNEDQPSSPEQQQGSDAEDQQSPESPEQQEGASAQNQNAQQDQQEGSPDGAAGSGGTEITERLTRAQAERILRALENQEKQLLREVQQHGDPERQVKKDW